MNTDSESKMIDIDKRKIYNENYKKKHGGELKKKKICDLCSGKYTLQTRTIHQNTKKHRNALNHKDENKNEKKKDDNKDIKDNIDNDFQLLLKKIAMYKYLIDNQPSSKNKNKNENESENKNDNESYKYLCEYIKKLFDIK